MTALMTAADFAPHAGSSFAVSAVSLPGGAPLLLTLVEVSALGLGGAGSEDGSEDGSARRPFSLLFDGPAVPPLGQQTYPLHHGVLGPLDIFLVPVGEAAGRREYQAVFS